MEPTTTAATINAVRGAGYTGCDRPLETTRMVEVQIIPSQPRRRWQKEPGRDLGQFGSNLAQVPHRRFVFAVTPRTILANARWGAAASRRTASQGRGGLPCLQGPKASCHRPSIHAQGRCRQRHLLRISRSINATARLSASGGGSERRGQARDSHLESRKSASNFDS